MPCVFIDTSQFKEILAALPELPPHNWLITDLDCYDHYGWDGCEKWAKRELFLTDEEFRGDINLRNMQMIWGVFSAIPTEYTKEDIYNYPLPEAETPRCGYGKTGADCRCRHHPPGQYGIPEIHPRSSKCNIPTVIFSH